MKNYAICLQKPLKIPLFAQKKAKTETFRLKVSFLLDFTYFLFIIAEKFKNHSNFNHSAPMRNKRKKMKAHGQDVPLDNDQYLEIYLKGKQEYDKRMKEDVRHIPLSVLVDEYWQKKADTGHSDSVLRNIRNTMTHVTRFAKREVSLDEIDRSFIIQFIRFLAYEAKETRHGGQKPLKKTTAQLYLGVFSSILRMAEKEGYIDRNPFDSIGADEKKPLFCSKSNRDYLTVEELRRMIDTPIKNRPIKHAFLFACFTGLRISDISRLCWGDIREGHQGTYITLVMQKTKEVISLKLNKNALRWLPPVSPNKNDLVFELPRFLGSVNGRLKKWAERAGIDKNVSFHTSRHTFATMELSLGADLYVVSKLLGHSNISTTQIYADIIDKKRDEAVDLLDTAFCLN
mgnify:CR=1 FL=1